MPLIATVILLIAIVAEGFYRPQPQDAEPFHARVRQAVEQVPKVIGDWEGNDSQLPPAAVALLRPNATLSRRYINKTRNQVADLLIVQCRDARDMGGHYPPVCYPAHGWTRVAERPVEWQIAGKNILGMEYEFSRIVEGRSVSCVVSDLMILPDGRFVREMDRIRRAAADYLRQFYGAAQIQIVTNAGVPAEERHEIASTLLEANVPLLDALCAGGTR